MISIMKSKTQSQSVPGHSGIKHAAIRVQSLASSLRFWKEVLGFSSYREKESDWAMVSRGDTTLSLITTSYDPASEPTGAPLQGAGIHHLGIVVDRTEEVRFWHERLLSAKKDFPTIQVSAPKLHRDESYGFYFRDPDQNPFEIIFIPTLHQEIQNLPSVVLLGHGSRDPRWPLPILKLKAMLEADHPSLVCEVAWMEFAEPDLNQALVEIKNRTQNPEVRVIPVFISAGGHVSHDLPELLETARTHYPELHLELTGPIGEELPVLQAMRTSILTSLAHE